MCKNTEKGLSHNYYMRPVMCQCIQCILYTWFDGTCTTEWMMITSTRTQFLIVFFFFQLQNTSLQVKVKIIFLTLFKQFVEQPAANTIIVNRLHTNNLYKKKTPKQNKIKNEFKKIASCYSEARSQQEQISFLSISLAT